MVILPVIRETPLQVSYQIRNRGSFTIPEAARKAHRLLIDLEVVSVTRNQYQNLMYNLPQGDYCNVTYWAGASIMKTRKVKYASERLIDWVNVEAGLAFNVGLATASVLFTLDNLAVALNLIPVQLDRRPPVVWGYPISHLKVVCPPETQIKLTCQWYPFPELGDFSSPDPDLDDPAEGEDEYPSPVRNPMSDPWEGNSPASVPQQERDTRDYDEAMFPNVPDQVSGTTVSLPEWSPGWTLRLQGTGYVDDSGTEQSVDEAVAVVGAGTYVLTFPEYPPVAGKAAVRWVITKEGGGEVFNSFAFKADGRIVAVPN